MRKLGCYACEQTLYCSKITNSIMCNFWITHFQLTLLPLPPSLCSLSSSCLLCCRIALFSVCAHAAVRCRSASAPALGTVCSHNIQMSTPVETQYEDKLSHWVDIVLPINKAFAYPVNKTNLSPVTVRPQRWAVSGWVTVFTQNQTAPKPQIIRTPSWLKELSKIMPGSLASAFAQTHTSTHLKLIGI